MATFHVARSAARAIVRRAGSRIAAPRRPRQRVPAQGGPAQSLIEMRVSAADALPAVVVLEGDTGARRVALRQLTARSLGLDAAEVEVIHHAGCAPRLATPAGQPILLSSTSRGGLAAVAASRGPVGIDLERVEPSTDPPWHVLHPAEQAVLRALDGDRRADAFARMWCGKEAYLKAIGSGLGREPQAVRIDLLDDDAIGIEDPLAVQPVLASTRVIAWGGARFVLALVVLGSSGRPWTIVLPEHQGCRAVSRTGEHEGGCA